MCEQSAIFYIKLNLLHLSKFFHYSFEINQLNLLNKNYKLVGIKMFGIVKNIASNIFVKNCYKFSAGYFSHRATSDNNDATPFDFTEENYK